MCRNKFSWLRTSRKYFLQLLGETVHTQKNNKEAIRKKEYFYNKIFILAEY